VLDIALRLGKLVQERLGAEVIQTRTEDTFVALEERTRIANERKVDLMISIHCNSAPTSKVRGIETYYLNFTSDSWELSVASLENAAASRSVHELQDLVSKIALEEKIEESRDFATKVQSRLHAGVSKHSSSIRDRGIRKAPFVVLIGAEMPAVLAEIAFISNRSDEALLKKSSFRQDVAEHLYGGIADYANSLGVLSSRRSLSAGSAQRD
jgi:N-acetylmuramoyl-L-alanine amidase